jgi:hypothetical protein
MERTPLQQKLDEQIGMERTPLQQKLDEQIGTFKETNLDQL